MISPDYVRLMAAYTSWQNQSIYEAASQLSDDDRRRDRGAFFKSIHGTLNHVLWGDQLWMHRLAGTREPLAANIPSSTGQYPDWEALCAARKATDKDILHWAENLETSALEGELSWHSAAMQAEIGRPRWILVIQLFNHGTHHRGQVHSMLTSAGIKPADTDVPFMPADYYSWGH
jgi:uncharacterized damage-inducible protein DinB